MHIRRLVVALFLIVVLGLAQVATSRFEGTVQDESGAVIPGAKVTAVNTKTQARSETTSGAEGMFIFPSLQPGVYTISVEAAGFRKAVVNDLELNAALTVSQRIKLEIGQVTESVVVEANAVRVQTSEAQIGRSVTMRDIDTLPQLGRSPIVLAVFQPGVQINPADPTFSQVNGLRQGSNNAKLDGIDVNDAVVPRMGLSMTANNTDSIGEFRMVTSGGKAEYGRSAGGQVELITRSGTNNWRGNGFDYLRNTALNASTFFNNASGVLRPKYIQNLFGGSMGGPIIHNKTFIFGNYQGSRVKQEVVRNRTVLTPQAKQGVFRWPGGYYDIARNDPRGKGIDPEMAKIFKLLPDPNNTDLGDGLNTAGFRFNNPSDSSNNMLTIKADHNVSSGHRIFFRYSWYKTYAIDALNNEDATYPGMQQGAQGGIRWGYSAGSDWAITPTIVNEFRFGHQSASVDFWRPARLKGPMILSNLFFNPISAAFPQGRNSPLNDLTDNITKIRNNHTFKAGVSMRFVTQYGYNEAGIYPNVTLGATSMGNTVPTAARPAGLTSIQSQNFDSLYNDVLGRMNTVTQTFYSDLEKFQPAGASRVRNHIIREQGWFFQDDWRVKRNLTLNLGLRWEFFGVPKERDGFMGTLDRIDQLNSVSQISDLKVTRKNAWYTNDRNNFAPRFGFAWDVRGDGKTAIRGAYGTFYDRLIGATISAVDGSTPGFSQQVSVYPNETGTDKRVGDGIPPPAQPGAPVLQLPITRSTTIAVFNPNIRAGYVHQYNLTIQKELLRNTVIEVGYVGTRGVKLFMNRDLNQPRVYGDFLAAFKELQAWQANSASLPSAGNTLVRIFGTPALALSGLIASTVQQGQVGTAANNLDRSSVNYSRYAAAGVSNFYLRNYPQYDQVRQGNNDGQSYYNSLQFSVRRQVGAVKVYANYTFSKSTDNSSVDGNGFTYPIDSYNLRLNKGRSDVDRPHSFNTSLIYILPVGRDKRFGGGMARWADSLIGGWEMGGLAMWQSGAPFTVGSTRATAASSAATWANYTGDRNIGKIERKGNGVWYWTSDEAARFGFPGAGEIGTSGRNTFRGPRFFGADLSLVKRFRLFETHTVTFRAEGYNLFNNPNFGAPGTNLTTPATFGKVSANVGAARVVQLALRYDF